MRPTKNGQTLAGRERGGVLQTGQRSSGAAARPASSTGVPWQTTSRSKRFPRKNARFEPSDGFRAGARIKSRAEYDKLYQESHFVSRDVLEARDFRARLRQAVDQLARRRAAPREVVRRRRAERHQELPGPPSHHGDERQARHRVGERAGSKPRRSAYAELHEKVVRFAAALRKLGVNKGDRVAIYMGMVPEVVIGMLACARIGAPHSVVFGGFAAESLRDRINDCGAKVVLTQDGAWRRGHVVPLKATVDKALADAPSVEKVVVFRRLGRRARQDRDAQRPRRGLVRGGEAPRIRLRGSRKSSTPSTRCSSCTPPAPPGSPRACCTPAPATWRAPT